MCDYQVELGMAITADEIESKAFVVSLRGYDRREVHRWLQDLAEHHRTLVTELEAATAPAVDLRHPRPGDAFTVVGLEVAGVLRAARDAAAAMLERALEDIDQVKAAAMADVEAEREARLRAIERVRAALTEDSVKDSDER